jgi:hypothetical protein
MTAAATTIFMNRANCSRCFTAVQHWVENHPETCNADNRWGESGDWDYHLTPNGVGGYTYHAWVPSVGRWAWTVCGIQYENRNKETT